MKYLLIKILVVLSAALFFVGCKKVLDQQPEYSFDAYKRFKTIDDYEYSLTAAYGLFRSGGYYGNGNSPAAGPFSTLPDIMSDNTLETASSLVNFRTFASFTFASTASVVSTMWLSAYSVVAQANLTLNGVPTGSTLESFSALNAAQVNRIKGQALAIRALAHFDMLRYFVEDYDRNSTKFGVPYLKQVELADPKYMPARGTVKQTYDEIEKDLKEALSLLTASAVTNTNRYRIDAPAVSAILARMYLYANQPDSAIKYSSQVISARPLATIAQFPLIWKDESTADVIWRVNFNNGEGSPASNLYFASGNRSSFQAHSSVISSYNQTADVRFASYIQLGTNNRNTIVKYLGKGAARDNVVDWKALRTGEQYLIRAEAYARRNSAGDELLAIADLNTLRNNRITGNLPLVGLTGTTLMQAIQDERRRELFAEGHRYFDLKRTTKTINRNPDCSYSIVSPGTVCAISSANRGWTWPIPQAEIDVNPNIKNQQNTGY